MDNRETWEEQLLTEEQAAASQAVYAFILQIIQIASAQRKVRTSTRRRKNCWSPFYETKRKQMRRIVNAKRAVKKGHLVKARKIMSTANKRLRTETGD